jgi:hypothetical protein
LDSPSAKTKETIDVAAMFSSERKSPWTLEAKKLYHLVDVRSQKIVVIQATLIELKEERDQVLAIINKHSQSLINATRMHSTLLSYTTGKHGNLVFTTPEPIMHHDYWTTKPLVLNLHPYPIYNQMFHLCDIFVVSCKCIYHAWCLGFHTQMFDKCEKSSRVVTFDCQ